MNLPSTHRMNTDDSYTSEEINAMVVVMKHVDIFEFLLYVITVYVITFLIGYIIDTLCFDSWVIISPHEDV